MKFASLKAALAGKLSDRTRWKRWGFEALAVAAVVGGVTAWQNSGLASGRVAPLTATRTDGTPAALGSGKTTLVVFWATWCGVCKAEARSIEALAQDWPVVSIAIQSGERDEIAEYLKERDLKLPAIADDDSDIAEAWGVRVVPAHFVIDPAGNIRFRVVGFTTTWGLRALLWWADNIPA
jgi:thiol-disulfide isomerase/thioredoxin